MRVTLIEVLVAISMNAIEICMTVNICAQILLDHMNVLAKSGIHNSGSSERFPTESSI